MLGVLILGAVMIALTFSGWVGYRFLQTYPERSKARAAADFLLSKNSSDQDVFRRGPTALPLLREDLKDRDAKRQLQAVKLIGAMGPRASVATPDLIDVLTDSKDPQVKVCAAAEAIPELVQTFDSTDDDLSSAAVRALGRIYPADPLVLPTLIRALKKDATLGDAADALAMMGPAARSATPGLLQALPRAELLDRQRTTRKNAESSELFDVRQTGLRSFRATETEAVDAALESVADGELAEVIAARKTQQAELVRAALASPDPLVRKVAATALSNWPGGAPVAENEGSN